MNYNECISKLNSLLFKYRINHRIEFGVQDVLYLIDSDIIEVTLIYLNVNGNVYRLSDVHICITGNYIQFSEGTKKSFVSIYRALK